MATPATPPQGTDIKALDDITDPEEYTTGAENVAYAQARRLLEPPNTHELVGDLEPYDSIDIRAWLGKRPTAQGLANMEADAADVLNRDERAANVDVTVDFTGSNVSVSFSQDANDEEQRLVLDVNSVSADLFFEDE